MRHPSRRLAPGWAQLCSQIQCWTLPSQRTRKCKNNNIILFFPLLYHTRLPTYPHVLNLGRGVKLCRNDPPNQTEIVQLRIDRFPYQGLYTQILSQTTDHSFSSDMSKWQPFTRTRTGEIISRSVRIRVVSPPRRFASVRVSPLVVSLHRMFRSHIVQTSKAFRAIITSPLWIYIFIVIIMIMTLFIEKAQLDYL